MRFRNQNINHPPPIKPMGEPWNYSVSPIYQNILNCFWDTQRPYEIKEYRNNNPRLRDPFRKINAYKVQQYLNHMNKNPFKEVDWVEDDKGVIRAVIMFYDLHKMNRDTKKVKSFCGNQYELDRTKGDVFIKEIACYKGYEEWLEKLIQKHIPKSQDSKIIVETDNQLKRNRDILDRLGFKCIDNIISSFADLYGIWIGGGEYKPIEKAQKISVQRLDVPIIDSSKLMEQILKLNNEDFSNHYSNYNKGNTWKGLSVRGYGGKSDFIIKPSEMVSSWKKENQDKMEWKVEDTPLRKILDEVEVYFQSLKKIFPHLENEENIERVRILKLEKGEGELERHTDIQDKNAGIGDGEWLRLHFPIQTNDKVRFTLWNCDGTKTNTKMGLGECWYLDMRKPHTAVNGGNENRFHLVFDIKSNKQVREYMELTSTKYETETEIDDYIE